MWYKTVLFIHFFIKAFHPPLNSVQNFIVQLQLTHNLAYKIHSSKTKGNTHKLSKSLCSLRVSLHSHCIIDYSIEDRVYTKSSMFNNSIGTDIRSEKFL